MATGRGLQLAGRNDLLKISATDVGNADDCPRCLALKIRPELEPTDWRRQFGDNSPFPLGDVLNLFDVALRQNVQPTDAVVWIRSAVEKYNVRPLLRPYVRTALLNALEAHWDSTEEVGEFTVTARNPEFGTDDRRLTVWGFLHSTDGGVREIRRFRIGAAHSPGDESDARWTATAARVAVGATLGPTVTRVRVVEVGLADASREIHFDGSREEAVALFVDDVRSIVQGLGDLAVAVPGWSCGSCKAAGVCDALVDVSGALAQDGPGFRTRSISAAALDTYRTCAAQWLLKSDLHLPRAHDVSEAQQRGLWVHQWLESAHGDGAPCSLDDHGPLDDHEFATALPYLRHHVKTCPLGTEGVEFVAADANVHGFDATADVVCVTKPDLIYRVGDRVIAREFKTAAQLPLGGADAVFTRSVQIPLIMSLLDAGLTTAFGGSSATVEVEVLSPEQARLYVWDVSDDVLASARERVADAVSAWHGDSTWEPTPGPQCTWCPVQEWCPDAHRAPQASGNVAIEAGFDLIPEDESPPF